MRFTVLSLLLPYYRHLGVAPSAAVRRDKYKLIKWSEKGVDAIETCGRLERFNLEDDMSGQYNAVEEMPEKAAQPLRKLQQCCKKAGAEEMTSNPDYDPHRRK